MLIVTWMIITLVHHEQIMTGLIVNLNTSVVYVKYTNDIYVSQIHPSIYNYNN